MVQDGLIHVKCIRARVGIVWALLLVLVWACRPGFAARYYVDSTVGGDARSGNARDQAWKSFQKVNATTFNPGDEILLKRGARWQETLHPLGSGTTDNPIRIGAYGEGPRPFIDGGEGPALLIYNQDAWVIESLEVTNNKAGKEDALKVWAGPRWPHYRFIRIRDCVAHDSGGSGIHVGQYTYGNYDDVVIEDCVSYNNVFTGIVVEAKDFAEIRGVVIRRSIAYGNGGDGIKIHCARDGVIEYCTAYRNGWKEDGRIGIWCWNSENIVIQFCESYENVNTHGPRAYDGGGFDIDWSCINCVIQYCYSHDNEGAGYLFMGGQGGFTTRSVVRFNISQNDGLRNKYGGILCYGWLQNSEVYNNVFYFKGAEEGAAIHFLGNNESAGHPSNVRVYNNIVIAEEGRAVLRVVPGAVGQNNTFDHNLYFSASRLRMIWGEKEIAEFDAFRKASGQEAHGINADPRLQAAGKGGLGRLPLDAYRLLPDSPCLGAGTDYTPDLGVLDYWGKAIHELKRLAIDAQQ